MALKKAHQSPAIKARAIQGLYALTPDGVETEELLRRVRLALQGGVQVLQYRNKTADAMLRLQQARALRELTREFGVTFIVNDDAQLAAAADADGVHLGASDGDIATARALLGHDKLIGVSCYNQLTLAHSAVQAGVDYVAFGAFYASTVKTDAAVATLDLLRKARAEIQLPIVAIGGISADNGAALVQAGADALAVISAVFDVADIQLAANNLAKLFR
ncbi:MAG: thiamine-phosphate diphosphorylase [Gallionellales bacterium 35-53-114]|jgi:thiamine-phosphate pyrophosphorylase|nr:MAG: thiamine-phosphate diphosphorylase [Gallionellales bacterium 35-53-114]OYZ62372.1 MAG: thiamine-phosphate diphosphorylase [Gallionellales bacterium 24-53-125]OZB07412.1 MAG: thiamine-phosphate diphosphorylase [Gallionellales bacterium 39-52-133]HQS59587.1 thiamine phosphate synthase [Gallionellaceae bacterium]HQS75510.1 thiamine phosphate synthase [Gallionellaceae bacterium]